MSDRHIVGTRAEPEVGHKAIDRSIPVQVPFLDENGERDSYEKLCIRQNREDRLRVDWRGVDASGTGSDTECAALLIVDDCN
jgi:hypothetical protein